MPTYWQHISGREAMYCPTCGESEFECPDPDHICNECSFHEIACICKEGGE